MHSPARQVGFALALTLVASFPASAAVIADLGGDFSLSGNPNGNWTYARAPTVGGTLTALDSPGSSGTGPDFGTWRPTGSDAPAVGANLLGTTLLMTGGSSSITLAAKEGWMHPGQDGSYAVARLTVPTTLFGTYSVLFEGVDSVGTTTDVHVLVNAVSMFSDTISGTGDTTSYSLTAAFSGGETIDIYVGTNGNGWNFDSTGVVATLVDAPEPATLAVLGAGMATLLAMRRRRSGAGAAA